MMEDGGEMCIGIGMLILGFCFMDGRRGGYCVGVGRILLGTGISKIFGTGTLERFGTLPG